MSELKKGRCWRLKISPPQPLAVTATTYFSLPDQGLVSSLPTNPSPPSLSQSSALVGSPHGFQASKDLPVNLSLPLSSSVVSDTIGHLFFVKLLAGSLLTLLAMSLSLLGHSLFSGWALCAIIPLESCTSPLFFSPPLPSWSFLELQLPPVCR